MKPVFCGLHIHPGEILEKEFMEGYNMTDRSLSNLSGIDIDVIHSILSHTKSIDRTIAEALGRVFDTTPDFWIILQSQYDGSPIPR